MKNPLLIEIIAYAPTAYYHCTHCEVAWREMGASNHFHQEQVNSSLPLDLAWEYQQVSDWVREVVGGYQNRVIVRMIDAATVEGFWKSIRYGIWRYPAVIVNGKARYSGDGFLIASREIARLLESAWGEKVTGNLQKEV